MACTLFINGAHRLGIDKEVQMKTPCRTSLQLVWETVKIARPLHMAAVLHPWRDPITIRDNSKPESCLGACSAC